VAKLGEGGMGEVYQARDTRLNRDVAIKVLPESFAQDADRLARFTREAQALAALNHPNIAAIYGLEDRALVMELVPGDDLATLISRGPMPLADVLPIARQIADALEAAHEHGIIHRDLKPANIKVKADGSVKVLDFGLAKAIDPNASSFSGGGANPSNSPTLTAHATQLGMIIGTAAYMAPEQARGRVVDRRADIWAFGAVLYEMLTGRRAFEGDDVSDILATVLKTEPAWTAIAADTPTSVRRVLRRCLEKDPRKRLSAIGDARLELDEPGEPGVVLPPPTRRRAPIVSMIIAGTIGALVGAGVLFSLWRPSAQPIATANLIRASLLAPESTVFSPDAADSAISPDGKLVVFTTGGTKGSADTQLWLRPVTALSPQLLASTTGAILPFWSADSRRIAFFADGKLKTIGLDGGRPEIICDAAVGRGGTWNDRGDIVFAPTASGPLFRVSANGGDPSPVTTLDAGNKETGHRFPRFLPDGDHFLYVALPVHAGKFNIFVGSLKTGSRELLASMENMPVYAEPGYLLFLRKGAVVAQRFDAASRKLSGEPTPLGDVPASPTSGANYSAGPAATASVTGTLAYLTEPSINTRLVWTDRTGAEVSSVALPAGRYLQVALSPDEQRAAVVRLNSRTESTIWLVDLVRGGAAPLIQAAGLNDSVVWSPDSTRIVFASDRDGPQDLYVKDVNKPAPEQRVYGSPVLFKGASSWSSNPETLVFSELTADANWNLLTLPLGKDQTPRPFLGTTAAELIGVVSPDGRWMSYVSDETGRFELYVQPFPDGGRKAQVTSFGAGNGRFAANVAWWRRDSKQLAYLNAETTEVLVADVLSGPDFHLGAAKVMANARPQMIMANWTGDLQRALMILPESGAAAWSLTLVTPWTAAMDRQR